MKAQATAKFVGTSTRKTGLVAGLIRGERAVAAQRILQNTDKRAAGPVGKVLGSAIANAENNHGLKVSQLVVESVLVGPGPSLKRSMPRAKGSASAIRKRMSHITVVVSDSGKPQPKLVKSAESKAETKEVTKQAETAGKEAK